MRKIDAAKLGNLERRARAEADRQARERQAKPTKRAAGKRQRQARKRQRR